MKQKMTGVMTYLITWFLWYTECRQHINIHNRSELRNGL